MSFNSLPNETLQRIVDLCHEADETYQKRVGDRGGVKQDSNKGDFLKDPCKAWRGKSCSAISMINKRLRSMAIKYIFTVSTRIFSFFQFRANLSSGDNTRHFERLDPENASFDVRSSDRLLATASDLSSSTIPMPKTPSLSFPTLAPYSRTCVPCPWSAKQRSKTWGWLDVFTPTGRIWRIEPDPATGYELVRPSFVLHLKLSNGIWI